MAQAQRKESNARNWPFQVKPLHPALGCEITGITLEQAVDPKLFDKVYATYQDNVLTYDLGLPTWPFFAIAWAGDVSAVVLIAIRTYRLIFHPEDLDSESPVPR